MTTALAPSKACTKCRVVQPLETGFYPAKNMNDGRASWCKACNHTLKQEISRRQRLLVIEALGGRCQWADEPCEVTKTVHLTIDHIHGGGSQVRKVAASSYSYYKEMMGHLDDFQLLCWNHNHEKRMLNGEHRKEGNL